MSQTPAVPPRPTKGQDKDESAGSVPKIPPRPMKRFDRSISPNPDRFAPSPLHEGIPSKNQKSLRFNTGTGYAEHSDDPINRSGSVPMPSVGEEGVEYSAINTELNEEKQKPSPEHQTATVAQDLKLHAPKPSLPAVSAKQRVQTVTRTDSDKAAAFGIGRPSLDEQRPSSRDALKKKPSTSFSTTSETDRDRDFNEEGIPEIGQRVPMNPHLGDVQAPSPAPGSEGAKRHHQRKHSARGGPPGSYGMHGHGVASQDKLDKAYYEKHPELLEREHYTPIHDRQNDFAMSSNDLNKLVRETTSRGSGLGTSSEYHATPTDEVGFKASEKYASRISSPLPADQQKSLSFKSEVTGPDGEKTIHVDEPEHPEYRSYGDEAIEDDEEHYEAPILAPDEVSKDGRSYHQRPAVRPVSERRGSAAEMDDPPSRPVSRPSSRPTSIYHSNASQDFGSTPLDDVKEYEPLFPEESDKKKAEKPLSADENKARHHFPSKDIWEDAPGSVHFTAEVSTPDVPEQQRRKSSSAKDRPKTPAHSWAQQQEELAEREVSGHAEAYVPRAETKEKPQWHEQRGFPKESRPGVGNRFPSKDVWEDTPESLLHETTISSPKEESRPEIPARPSQKASESPERPAVPQRPKPKQTPSDEAKVRPPVSDKPKPQIPPRPTKSTSGDSKDGEFSKPKPPVPSRPVGSKIASLQAGFMSDLNKRLQLGPQAPKKEEPKPQEDLTEETEKAPLSDARKGRARGPQRRAPARSPAAPAAETAKASVPTLAFSVPQTLWSIDPEQGDVSVFVEKDEAPVEKRPEAVPETVESPEPAESAEKSEVAEPPAEEPKEAPAEPTPPEPQHEETTTQEEPAAPALEAKTLVANTAGESVLETTIEKKDDKIEPVEVEDTPKA